MLVESETIEWLRMLSKIDLIEYWAGITLRIMRLRLCFDSLRVAR